VRFVVAFIILACASQVSAHDRDVIRDARAVAASMVVASGPVRGAPSHSYTPPPWRANRSLAGTYRDVDARHRFTRYTYGWHAWYGCWIRYGPCGRSHAWHGCW
jgi:hypothetical protein